MAAQPGVLEDHIGVIEAHSGALQPRQLIPNGEVMEARSGGVVIEPNKVR
jgi:hypothetical protein